MLKEITENSLKEHNACIEGVNFFKKHNEKDPIKLLKLLMVENHHDWANWLIVRLLTKKQRVKYASFAVKDAEAAAEAARAAAWAASAAARAKARTAEAAAEAAAETRARARTAEAAAAAAWAAETRAKERAAYEKYVDYGIELLIKENEK